MPRIQMVEVVDASAKDARFPPENLIGKSMAKRWLCKRGEMQNVMSATFKFSKPSFIRSIDLGNAGSASVTLLVSRSTNEDFKEILASTDLRSEMECRSGSNKNTVKMFECSDLREATRHEKWEFMKIVCYQPYRRNQEEQFGLSFISVHEPAPPSKVLGSVEKLREAAFRSSLPAKQGTTFTSNMSRSEKMMASAKKGVAFANDLSRAEKMIMATKIQPSSPVEEMKSDDDLFKATVLSFLEANTNIINSALGAKTDLLRDLEDVMERKLSFHENRIFMQIFQSYVSGHKEKQPSGILTARTTNRQILTSPTSRKMEDTKISLLKPQLTESFNAFNTQTVYFAEVVHSHPMKEGPVSYLGRSGKENSPYLLEKHGMTNGSAELEESCAAVGSSDRNMCLDPVKNDKFLPRDSWKKRNDIDACDSRDCSPDTWLKRKSDPTERSQPANKKRPRDNSLSDDKDGEPLVSNRVTPAGGWLLNNTGLHKKSFSPPAPKNDALKFPFRVSPPPPPDRPASPIPLVDDIDQPSTSSRETVAERNIRLEMERRLAERSPPERVVQRTSSGKVKGTFCTKGMNTNESPLRRLSICDENDEMGSPQARRKLSYVGKNGQEGDSDCQVECPVCKGFFDSAEINKHLDDCVPSPIKKPDDSENDDEMACPICCLWLPKDTVAAHADECAQKRYGA